jgi:hypothetical protein
MNYIEKCLEKFNELPQEIQDYLNSDKVVKALKEIEEEHGMDLKFALTLIFIDEIGLEDLPLYIEEKYKADNNTINKVLLKMENDIFKEIADSFSEEEPLDSIVEDTSIINLSDSEKKSLILDVFSSKVLEKIKSSEEHLFSLNAIIFESIGREEIFAEKIKKAFLSNQEKISDKKITLDKKEEEPSIANWIKDFISKNGSANFSAISLAKYLSSSQNVSKLNSEEKQILRQILKIYKNLVFFPDSMENLPYKDWEIFPINRDLLDFYKDKKSIVNKKLKKETEEKEVKKETEEKEVKKETEESEIKKEKLKDEDLLTLESMRGKYPEKSLERKAIELEIKKRKK